MKKKGFTLVELLAVIVIIAVIAVIAIPIVLNNVTSAEKKSFKISVNEVKRNSDRYLVKNNLKKLPTCGYNNVVLKNIDFLKNRDIFTSDSYMCYDDDNACDYIYAKSNLKKSGKVILAYGCFDDIKYEEGQKENDDNLKKPEIANLSFVNTSSSISVNIDWKDEIDPDSIRFAIRKVDGGKLSEWQKSNKFKNLKNDTEYKVIVKAKNKRGIFGDAQDTTKTLDIDVPTYSKDVDTTYSDKDINVTIKYPTPRNGESYTYFYTLDSGETWIETKDKLTTIKFTKNGNVSARVFDGTNYKDASEYIVSGIDKTTPSCSIKVASGTLGENGWYTSDTTLKLTTSKAGVSGIEYSTPTLSSEEYKFKVSNGNVGESSSSFTSDGSFVVYGYVKNGAGKTAKCTLDYKKDSNPISVGVTLKTKSGSDYTQGKYSSEDIILTAVPKATTAPSGYSYKWYKAGSENSIGSSKSYTATGDGIYNVEVISGSGNTKKSGNYIINIDKCSIPQVSISGKKATAGTSISSGTWSNENIVLTATPSCTTGGNSGYSYGWRKDGDSKVISSSKSYTATSSGTYTVKLTLGNGKEASFNYSVKIDKTAPTCNITVASGTLGANGYTSNVGLKMTASTGGSGIDKYTAFSTSSSATYGTDGGGKTSLEISKTVSLNGTYTYYGYVKNKVGLTGTCSKTITVNKPKPTCNITVASGTLGANSWYTTDVTLKMTASSAGGDGIDSYTAFSTSSSATYGTSGGGKTSLDVSKTVSSNGTYTYYGYVKNSSGLTGTCSKTIKINKNIPTVTITGKKVTAGTSVNSGDWSNENIILTANPTCSGCGKYSYKWYYYDGDEQVTTQTHTATSSGSYTVKTTLENGKESSYTYTARIDKTAPTCSITASGEGPAYEDASKWYNSDVNLKMTASTGGSGIDKYTAFSTSSSATYGTDGGGKTSLETSMAVSSDGIYTYYGYVKNKAGSTATCKKMIRIDKTAPTALFSGRFNYCLKDEINYTIYENGSGINFESAYCKLYNSNGTFLRKLTFSDKSINVNPKSYGKYKLECYVHDLAANNGSYTDLSFGVKPCLGDSVTYIPDASGRQATNNCQKDSCGDKCTCVEECSGKICYSMGPSLNSGTAYGTTNELILINDNEDVNGYGYQYGPYMRFEPGCYQVTYNGSNLNAEGLYYKAYVAMTDEDYTDEINKNISKSSSKVSYNIDFKGTSNNNGLEFAIWVKPRSFSHSIPYITSLVVTYKGESCQ